MKKWLKSRGFTDRLYFANLCFAWVYSIICIAISLKGGLESYACIEVVCPLIWAELTVHTGLVVWKAKVENLSKWTGKGVTKNANMNINMDI